DSPASVPASPRELVMLPCSLRMMVLAVACVIGGGAAAQPYEVVEPTYDTVQPAPEAAPAPFSLDEMVGAGHQVFGEFTQGFAGIVERAVSAYGLPNGYIVGEE